jgi:hypothetical protein
MDIITNTFTHAVALSALAVVALHEILKLKFVPWGFVNKYPVLALILLSIGASAVVAWRTAVQPQTFADWVVLVATTAVTAALTYITTIKNWAQLRAMEGSGE